VRILVSGSTGLVGSAAADVLAHQGHEIVRLIRPGTVLPGQQHTSPAELRHIVWNPATGVLDSRAEGADALIHLAGASIAGHRWTQSWKRELRESRVAATRSLIASLRQFRQPPRIFIAASAIGFYGNRGDEILTETAPAADDFLGKVAVAWEQEAQAAEPLGVRVARLRIGMVLGPNGGALARILPPFRMGVGGRLGSGKQWMSWIHIQDLIALITFLMKESTVRGVFNATSPFPVTNREFTQALADAVHRPAILPVPAFALRWIFGQMSEVLLASQRVFPDAAQRAGFIFQHPDIFAALAQLTRAA